MSICIFLYKNICQVRKIHFFEKGEEDTPAVTVSLPMSDRLPKNLHVTFRPPVGKKVNSVNVNGKQGTAGGAHRDTAVIQPSSMRHFEVIAELS